MMTGAGIYRIQVQRRAAPPAYYFGQSINPIERWSQHLRALRAGRHDNLKMQRAFVKYGESAFSFSIILICTATKEAMTLYEQSILDFYLRALGERRMLNVMRQCVNSHLGVKRRPETIIRMSASQKGRKKTPEQIAKMSAMMTGSKRSAEVRAAQSIRMRSEPLNPNFAAAREHALQSPLRLVNLRLALVGRPKVHSVETVQKISRSLIGKKQSESSNAKRSATLAGRKHSPEHIAARVASRRAKGAARMADQNGRN